MDFLSKLLKFFFGLFLSGLVLAFAIAPALESLAEAEPPPDPAFATALVAAGPFVAIYLLGFLWSFMGDMAWDMLPSVLKYVFGALTIAGLGMQLVVIVSMTFMVMALAGGAAGEGSQGLALLGGAALVLFVVVVWLTPFIFWLGYMWFPINLLTRSAPVSAPEPEKPATPEAPSARARDVLSQYGAPHASSRASTEPSQTGQGLLNRALQARHGSDEGPEGPG